MVEKASKKFVVIVDETKVSITGSSSSVKWLDEGLSWIKSWIIVCTGHWIQV
jgi:hypothetical protein